MKPIKVPIEDILDLHTFNPKEIPDLLTSYFAACIDAKIYSVRIVHGKGQGVLRERVRSILKHHAMVESFRNAPSEAGGWGATLVDLKRN